MVTIKPFDQQNVALHYKWTNDEELSYYQTENLNSSESFNDFLRRIKTVLDDRNKSADLFEIYLAENNKLIGVVELHGVDLHNHRCYINCTIGDRKYTGKKYEIAALRKMLAYCFNELEMHKVCTTAMDFNTKWIEEVQKMGFKQEGHLREHIAREDTFCDKLIFGLLDTEYQRREQSTELRVAN